MPANSEYAIDVQDVSKIYRLYDKPIDRLKESLSLSHKNYHKDHRDQWFRQVHDLKDHYRGPDSHLRPGSGGRGDLRPSGAGGRIQHGLYRH